MYTANILTTKYSFWHCNLAVIWLHILQPNIAISLKLYSSKSVTSPGFLGCKTRGSNFWSMQKFVPKLQKLWYLLHWLDQLFLGKSKIFLQKTYSVGSPAIAIKMQKNYPIMQKFLHGDSKTTFCSVENPGYWVSWISSEFHWFP